MAVETPCQTPGAIFHVGIKPRQVSCIIDLPEPLNLTEAQARVLEANMHNAAELVLARYFPTR